MHNHNYLHIHNYPDNTKLQLVQNTYGLLYFGVYKFKNNRKKFMMNVFFFTGLLIKLVNISYGNAVSWYVQK